jgi:hypothetical protein
MFRNFETAVAGLFYGLFLFGVLHFTILFYVVSPTDGPVRNFDF